MTGMNDDPVEESKRYRAALDMAVHAEASGLDIVNLEEHHCAENGWLPAPLTLAAMIIARTHRIRVTVTALLVTLYDPIRLAEEIAILDLVSEGRFSFVAGLGYRPLEYHATGRSWKDRGRLMDETIETLLTAWKGEPFTYRGRTIRVTPRPMSRPHPFFFIGGMSAVAARRAARFGLPFHPPMRQPELEAIYHAELARHGNSGFVYSPAEGNSMLVVEDDPESAWRELAPYFLRELREYGEWKVEGVPRPSEEDVSTVDELREQKRFEILTPDECIERYREQDGATAVLHPLAGGIPTARAWASFRRFTDQVLPAISAAVS
jgi:alkanesulfonate monooxygenase SsuD/methylene tetrahydromethanopterin reductase-like flavin-dependent oxidoreductase (luciferase family)